MDHRTAQAENLKAASHVSNVSNPDQHTIILVLYCGTYFKVQAVSIQVSYERCGFFTAEKKTKRGSIGRVWRKISNFHVPCWSSYGRQEAHTWSHFFQVLQTLLGVAVSLQMRHVQQVHTSCVPLWLYIYSIYSSSIFPKVHTATTARIESGATATRNGKNRKKQQRKSGQALYDTMASVQPFVCLLHPSTVTISERPSPFSLLSIVVHFSHLL